MARCERAGTVLAPNARKHTHCTHGTCGVLDCLLFCDQTRPNLRISLVGYHCAIEFPRGVPLFYCCKYPTTYGVRVHPLAAQWLNCQYLFIYLFGITLFKQWHTMYVNIGASIKTISKYNSYNS